MDYKKTNAPLTTTVHDIIEMAEPTGNIYETVCIISKRANQIAAEDSGFDEVVMVTPDKDFAQLVTSRVKMYRFGRAGKPDQILSPLEVHELFGVNHCRQVIDLLGLWGDASDNIPGVPGIGEKTALNLIRSFGSLQGVYDNISSAYRHALPYIP